MIGPTDLLFYKLKDLITEQSEGEWDDATIVRDAHHFANNLRPLTAPVSPDSDLLKEAVGLLAASIDLMTDDYQDCASHRAETRAFLSKVEERG